jgi:hypothetical protein
MSQQDLLINRLQQGWLDSLQAANECACLKLTTRVNEPFFLAKIEAMGLRLSKKVKTGTRYVMYKLERVS